MLLSTTMLSTKSHISILLLVCCGLLLLAGCGNANSDDVVLAKVYSHELLASDVEGLVDDEMLPDDSAAVVDNYINQWVMQMVLLEKAESNVTRDFQKELQNYKNSLVIYEYEQQIVRQLLDTNVSDQDIEDYYNSHKDDFLLKSSIVKAIYVKLDKGSIHVNRFKRLMQRDDFDDADIVEVQQLAERNAVSGYFDVNTWITFFKLRQEIPINTYNEELYLKNTHNILIDDGSFIYLARIMDYKITDQISPLELEADNIKTIILNARRLEILESMQKDLLYEAETSGHVELYNNNEK